MSQGNKVYEEYIPAEGEMVDPRTYLRNLLAHIKRECESVPEGDWRRDHWAVLPPKIDALRELLDTVTASPTETNASDLCVSSYMLGKIMADLERENPKGMIGILEEGIRNTHELIKLKAADHQRKKGITLKRSIESGIKKGMQLQALHLWNADSDKELRIGEVAKLLHKDLQRSIREVEEYPYDCPTEKTIRGWIKEVAPTYASQRGRPKK